MKFELEPYHRNAPDERITRRFKEGGNRSTKKSLTDC